MEFLSKIESTFSIPERGLIVVPEEPKDDFRIRIGNRIQLRASDGHTRETHMTGVELLSGKRDDGSRFSRMAILVTADVAREDVPVGSEIWYRQGDAFEDHSSQQIGPSRWDV